MTQREHRFVLGSTAGQSPCVLVFDAGYVVESVKRTIDGKEKRFQNKTPISFVLSPAGASPSPSEGGGSNPQPVPTNNGDDSDGD